MNKLKILVISREKIASVKMCALNELHFLSTKYSEISYIYRNYNEVSINDIRRANIVIFVRSDSSEEKLLSRICKNTNTHAIYVLDDDLLNVPNTVNSYAHYAKKETISNIVEIMQNCDTLLSTSNLLIDKYAKYFKNAFLIEEPVSYIKEEHNSNEKLKIGFAGSIDHAGEISKLLKKSLERIYREYKDKIKLEFIGTKPDFGEDIEYDYYPYTNNYEEYQKLMTSLNWDIGLAPLIATPFSECKYYNKYVEYSSFGIVGLYSNVLPYTNVIKDGENGYLVNNDEDSWYKALKEIIENKEGLINIRNNIIKDIKTRFLLDTNAELYLKYITDGYQNNKVYDKNSYNALWQPNKLLYKLFGIIYKYYILKNSIYFDPEWYKQTYKVQHPYYHYLHDGWNNNPSKEFNTSAYIKKYNDIKNICPLIHYEVYGKREGRDI